VQSSAQIVRKGKEKEADLYSAFIEVPYTQGAHTLLHLVTPQTNYNTQFFYSATLSEH